MKVAIIPVRNPHGDCTRGDYGELIKAVGIVLESDENGKRPAGSCWVFDSMFGLLSVDPEEYLSVVVTDE